MGLGLMVALCFPAGASSLLWSFLPLAGHPVLSSIPVQWTSLLVSLHFVVSCLLFFLVSKRRSLFFSCFLTFRPFFA
jgi:hypothetical protein